MVSKLIVLAAIVLGVMAVAQLMKVYELSSKLGNKNEGEISDRQNKMSENLLMIFGVLLFGARLNQFDKILQSIALIDNLTFPKLI